MSVQARRQSSYPTTWGPSEYNDHERPSMKENWGKWVYLTVCTIFVAVIFVVAHTFSPVLGVVVSIIAAIAYMLAIRANPYRNPGE